jgi:hypothetical protein
MNWKERALNAEKRAAEAESQALVSQVATAKTIEHSQNLRAFALESVELMRLVINASDVRMAPGIYFLLNQAGEVVYVGKSSNVLLRMSGHREKQFSSVRMIEVRDEAERSLLECRFIHILKPQINVSMTAFNSTHELLNIDVLELARSVYSPMS